MVRPDRETPAPVKKRQRVSRLERSRRIWEEVEQAVRAVALRRGWPHATYDDLYAVVRRLAEENPDQWMSLIAGFGGAASLYRDNLRLQFMDLDEIKSFQPAVKKFIKSLENL